MRSQNRSSLIWEIDKSIVFWTHSWIYECQMYFLRALAGCFVLVICIRLKRRFYEWSCTICTTLYGLNYLTNPIQNYAFCTAHPIFAMKFVFLCVFTSFFPNFAMKYSANDEPLKQHLRLINSWGVLFPGYPNRDICAGLKIWEFLVALTNGWTVGWFNRALKKKAKLTCVYLLCHLIRFRQPDFAKCKNIQAWRIIYSMPVCFYILLKRAVKRE